MGQYFNADFKMPQDPSNPVAYVLLLVRAPLFYAFGL